MARPRGARQNNNRPRDGHAGGGDRDRYRDGDRDREYDRYRDRDMGRRSPPRSAPSYDRGRPESDSWRPADDRRYDDHRASDSYRPRPPQSDFTFQAPAGAPSFTASNQPPPPRGPRRDRGRGQRGRGRGRWQPIHPSERALISGATQNLPEERLNLDGAAKFRDLESLSDDDEQEMEISSRSSQSDTEAPSKKRARTTAEETSAGNAAPKWSNPDPYTALPCPDDTLQKKRDVVKLIRKARVAEIAAKSDAPADTQDFISFDLSSDEDEGSQEPPLPSQPPPPPLSQLPPPPPPEAAGLPPKPAAADLSRNTGSIASKPVPSEDRSGPLGSRKRTADDVIKPPDYGQLKKVSMKPVKGMLVPNWQPKPDEEPCPWATIDHSATRDLAFR